MENKMIEEMAKALTEFISVYGDVRLTIAGATHWAIAFKKFGITKLPKDSVVLSKEEWKEYEQFKSFMERNDWESIDDIETTLDKCQEVLYERLQQARKETTEKIIFKLVNYLKARKEIYKMNSDVTATMRVDWAILEVKQFAKHFSVEIKE